MSDESLPKKEENVSDTEENNSQPAGSLALDLGDDCVYNVESNRLGFQAPSGAASAQEPSTSNTKREDNPFSFKHFLRDSPAVNKNYQSLGARPKVLRESRSRHVTPPESPQRPSHSARKIGEFSSALPDFVQDHLVIEQCFLGSKPSSAPAFDLDLPDFAQGDQKTINGPTVSRSNSLEEPSVRTIPLDLPGLSLGNAFPLDLPLPANPVAAENRNNTPLVEVGNSKSLPDFLTDGPVRTNTEATTPSPSAFTRDSVSRTASRCRHCVELTAELTGAMQRLSRTEDEVEGYYRRAIAAENTITRLKQELKSLKSQLRQVQAENQVLREGDGGAAGGGEASSLELPAQRLAQELRAAASTAEHSLRSLLTGVDNLRIMASTLENINRIEEKPNDRFSRFDDDSTGPAL